MNKNNKTEGEFRESKKSKENPDIQKESQKNKNIKNK